MLELKQFYRTPVLEDHPEAITLTAGERSITYRKVTWSQDDQAVGLRYGENPHQPAAFYAPEVGSVLGGLSWLKLGKGGPSWINLADIDHALRILKYMDRPAAAVMKHLNPAGVAVRRDDEPLSEVYLAARASDERASFGGVAAFNREVDVQTAEAVLSGYIEVIVAPGYTPEAIALLSAKKDLRVAQVSGLDALPKYVGDDVGFDLKVLGDGSMLLQKPFLTKIRSADDFSLNPSAGDVRCEAVPTKSELSDMMLAWYVTTGVRSNAVVFVKDGRTLAVGTGEQERVGSVEQAIAKALQKGHDLRDSVVSSDAFFPFRDAIDALAAVGVRAIVQPGGSLRDSEVIQACNEHGMAMAFTGERCFGHF